MSAAIVVNGDVGSCDEENSFEIKRARRLVPDGDEFVYGKLRAVPLVELGAGICFGLFSPVTRKS